MVVLSVVVLDDDADAVAFRGAEDGAGDGAVVATGSDDFAGLDLPLDLVAGEVEDLDAVDDLGLQGLIALALGDRRGLVFEELLQALGVEAVHLLR
jgi:hypothetical protein